MNKLSILGLIFLFIFGVLSCRCGTFMQAEREEPATTEQSWEDITAYAEEAVMSSPLCCAIFKIETTGRQSQSD